MLSLSPPGSSTLLQPCKLRNNRPSNRSGRSQIDHDVFEGLPIRHWRKAPVAVSTASQKDELTTDSTRDTLFIELALPRDSQLLHPMSQALLRAARSGEIPKKAPPQPLVEEDKEQGEDYEPVGETDLGFLAKRWAAVPRHLEGPEPEFLAKRRKGLPSAYTGPLGQIHGAAPMRKIKVKKTDTEGNAAVLDVLVPEGQTVEGEVPEEEANLTQAPAPGTVVEGVGVANAEGVIVAGDQMLPTPPRRRPPPPKRKAKGSGRGRKKKVAFTPNMEGDETTGFTAVLNESADNTDGVPEGQPGNGTTDGDVTMGFDEALQNAEESSEESDEGEEGDEGDREDGELSPSPPSSRSPPKHPPFLGHPPVAVVEEGQRADQPTDKGAVCENSIEDPNPSAKKDVSSSPDLPLAADHEMAALPITRKPPDDRISPPQDGEQLLSVEEASYTAEQLPLGAPVAAELSLEHNPLEGLAQPKAFIPDNRPSKHQTEHETQLSDGEVDLLGSLEKQLNRDESTVSSTL
ncbi:MAG: hypothetical protein Q9173_000369 [Seirophora scorigena]